MSLTSLQTPEHQRTFAPPSLRATSARALARGKTLAKTGSAVELRIVHSLQETTTTRTAAMTHTAQARSIHFPDYHFLQAGEGDQFVFDLNTVLGKQMAKTLDWLDESDEETTVTCCTREGPKTKTCGGESGQSCQNVCGEGDSFHLFSPFHNSQPFSFSVTKIHYAFRDFEENQCETDLFYRNTGLWEVEDICPAPKTWVAYVEPDYSTYSHQGLPSYSRGKRMAPQACEDINDVDGVRAGCNYSSLDLSKMCQGVDAKAIMKNALCCWFGNYISKLKANKQLNVKGNSIKDACCEATKLKTGGTDPTPPAVKCPGQARQ